MLSQEFAKNNSHTVTITKNKEFAKKVDDFEKMVDDRKTIFVLYNIVTR